MGMSRLFSCLLVVLVSSCAVISQNDDLVLSKKIQSPSTLELQSETLRT